MVVGERERLIGRNRLIRQLHTAERAKATADLIMQARAERDSHRTRGSLLEGATPILDEESLSLVRALLSSNLPEETASAAFVLSEYGGEIEADLIAAMLEKEVNESVKAHMIHALGEIGGMKASIALADHVANKDNPLFSRVQAMSSLHELVLRTATPIKDDPTKVAVRLTGDPQQDRALDLVKRALLTVTLSTAPYEALRVAQDTRGLLAY